VRLRCRGVADEPINAEPLPHKAQILLIACERVCHTWRKGGNAMSSIFYIIGVVVVVLIILSFLGLR